LEGLSFELNPGEVVGILGCSGSGKSVLLQALSGLVPWARGGRVAGEVRLCGESLGELDPSQRSHHLATCLDRPEVALFLPTVAAELDAAVRLFNPAKSFADEIRAVLAIDGLIDRQVVELSSGERQRVALGVTLFAAPRPLLLDEPTAHLDESGVVGLCRCLDVIRSLGGSALLTEHAGWRLGSAVDRWFELRDGRLLPAYPPSAPTLSTSPCLSPGDLLLDLPAIRLERGSGRLIESGALVLRAGEVVTLTGPNGAGKSSLARALGGHAFSAGVRFSPGEAARWRARDVAVLLPSPDLQLFAPTAIEELRLAGLDSQAAGDLLGRLQLTPLAARAPWTLSRGERQRLLLGAMEANDAPILILDEPAQGLDAAALDRLVLSLHQRAARGGAVLVLTHRAEFAAASHRRLHLAFGQLGEAA
jgi:energy-coupling factor transport system ATP-binding protein